MPRTKRPACGGKGPCCHIGYAHRHCEHCDQVISLVSYAPPYYWNPIYQFPMTRAIGTYNTFGDVGNAAAAPSVFNVQHGNTGDFARALETSWKDASATAPAVAHACEAN
jgi:hypothetical protein